MDVTPFLMLTGQAEEAMSLYAETLPDAEVLVLEHAEGGGVSRGLLRIGSRTLRFFDSPVEHAFGFTPAISLFVDCDSADEVAGLAGALSEGGAVLMPLGSYPFAQSFAWVSDRFGVSWQLSFQEPAGG